MGNFLRLLDTSVRLKKNVKSFMDIMIDIEKNQCEFPLQRLFSQLTRGRYENRLL